MQKMNFKAIGTKLAGVTVGTIGGDILSNKLLPATMDAKIKGAILMLSGAVLPEFAKKVPLIGDIGSGLIANGALVLGKAFLPSMVSGVDNNGIGAEADSVVFDLNPDEVSGPNNDNAVGALDEEIY